MSPCDSFDTCSSKRQDAWLDSFRSVSRVSQCSSGIQVPLLAPLAVNQAAGRLLVLCLLPSILPAISSTPNNVGNAGNTVTKAGVFLAMRLALLPKALPWLVLSVTRWVPRNGNGIGCRYRYGKGALRAGALCFPPIR